MTTEETLKTVTEARIKEIGGFLVSLKVHAGRKIVIEFDKPEGVKISDCAQLNRSLSNDPELLPIFEQHELEVGSPGADSPFRVKEQYLKNVGKKVNVIIEGEGLVPGILQAADDDGIGLKPFAEKGKPEPAERRIAYSQIKETRKVLAF